MGAKLEKEFTYYIEHQNELVKEYEGKHIVIKGGKVLGAYDSEIEAVEETAKAHKLGTFLVQKCTAGRDSYTQLFHSRVAV